MTSGGSPFIMRALIVFFVRPDISIFALITKSSGWLWAWMAISVRTGSDCPIGPHQLRSSMGRVVARPVPAVGLAAASEACDRQPPPHSARPKRHRHAAHAADR